MIYVVVQFACIIWLISQVNFFQLSWLSWLLLMLASVVGFLAVVNMTPKNLNIIPQLKTNHKLITKGIYRFIRHPMYSSILLAMSGLILSNPVGLDMFVYLVLLVNLWLKSSLEEQYLCQRFTQYHDYQQKTGRFLPFI